jgi:hypothetical protein
MTSEPPSLANESRGHLPRTAPRWTTLVALWAIAVALISLLSPRWKLIPLLGGATIYSKRSITFGPGIVEFLFLLAATGCCISLLRTPTNPVLRTTGGLIALAGSMGASMVLAGIPAEAVGYSLSPTPSVRIGQVAIGTAAVALLIPYGSIFQHRILDPKDREGAPHPARNSPPTEFELDSEEPG